VRVVDCPVRRRSSGASGELMDSITTRTTTPGLAGWESNKGRVKARRAHHSGPWWCRPTVYASSVLLSACRRRRMVSVFSSCDRCVGVAFTPMASCRRVPPHLTPSSACLKDDSATEWMRHERRPTSRRTIDHPGMRACMQSEIHMPLIPMRALVEFRSSAWGSDSWGSDCICFLAYF
jgi:hypothetical protein